MKKMCFFTALLFIINTLNFTIPAQAAGGNILYFCEDFEGVTTGVTQTLSYTPNKNKIRIEETNGGNQSLALSIQSTDNATVQKGMDANRLYGQIVIEMDLTIESNSKSIKSFVVRNRNYSAFTPFRIDGRGDVWSGNDSYICTVSENVPHRFSVVFDIESKLYSVYVDNIERVHNRQVTLSEFEEIAYLNWTISYVTEGCQTRMLLDNIKVYNGSEPLSDSEFSNTQFYLQTEYNAWFSNQMINEYMKNKLALYVGSCKALNGGTQQTLEAAPVIDGGTTMVPAKDVIETLGGTVAFSKTGNMANISINGSYAEVNAGSAVMSVNGMNITLPHQARILNGVFLLPIRTIAELAGKNIFWDDCGLIILNNNEEDISWYDNPYLLNAIIAPMVYERPTGDDIIAAVKSKHPNRSHPRLFLTNETVDAIREEINTSRTKAKWFSDIMAEADTYLETPLSDYGTMSMINVGQFLNPLVESCAFVYLVTGDTRYAERVARELENVANFPSYEPTSSMLYLTRIGVAMIKGYDWLYDYLSDDIKADVINAVVNKMYPYLFEDYYNETTVRGYRWAQAKMGDNWNVICNNSAIQSAMAICDEDGCEEVCGRILDEAIISIEKTFDMLAPDGAWYEGPSYWTATSDNIACAVTCFETAAGYDYGFTKVPGFKSAGYFLAYMRGEDYGYFNYNFSADFNRYDIYQAVLASELFYAEKTGNPALITEYVNVKNNLGAPGTWQDFIYTRADVDEKVTESLPLDRYFAGAEVVTMRDTWAQDDTMFFAGIHSGQNNCPNSQLDIGTFVIDAYGTRFISDLGTENYNLAGYYEKYRNRAEGNNCIIINPSTNFRDQNISAYTIFERFEHNDISAYAITDMTQAYEDKVISAKRGMKMTNHRTAIVLQDEIRCIEPSEIYWGAHTRANVEIQDSKTAILERDGIQMEAKILSSDGTFSTMPAEPMTGKTYEMGGQTVNDGVTKLTVHFENVQNVDLVICFTPLSNVSGVNVVYPNIVPLDDWALDIDGETPRTVIPDSEEFNLSALTLDGETIEGFEPGKNVYNVVLKQRTSPMPKVEATVQGGVAEVVYPDTWPAPIKIYITKNGMTCLKTINFEKPPISVSNETHDEIKIVSAQCKQWSEEPYNSPEESYDNDFNTRFSGNTQQEGGNYIIYELENTKKVDTVGLAFFNGAQRKTFISIALSTDNVNWTTVFDGASNGETDRFEYFETGGTDAKYIKVTGTGTDETGSPWLSILEFKAFEKKPYMVYNSTKFSGQKARLILTAYKNDKRVLNVTTETADISDGAVITGKLSVSEEGTAVKNIVLDEKRLEPLKGVDSLNSR